MMVQSRVQSPGFIQRPFQFARKMTTTYTRDDSASLFEVLSVSNYLGDSPNGDGDGATSSAGTQLPKMLEERATSCDADFAELPNTLVDSCLHCIEYVRSSEVELNKKGYDELKLFEDQSYARDIEVQLREGHQQILITFVGLHNAGKSTLINAILGDDLLPQRIMNETGIRVYIQHNPNYHRGPCNDRSGKCSKCPLLVPFRDGIPGADIKYQGKKEIKRTLRELNQRSRNNPKEEVCPHLLLLNVPILMSAAKELAPGQQVYLVDTPGLGDSKRSIAELAEKSVLTSPAYVYIMSYSNLEDERDSNAFMRMHGKDGKLLENKQLVVAVTKYDQFFETSDDERDSDDDDDDDNDESKKKDVERRVCQQLKDTLQLQSPIPRDLVIPVSGKWALRARTSQNPSKLDKHWEAYSKKASLSNETASNPVQQKLLDASEVPKLEKRIEEIAQNSFVSWVQNMKGNSLGYVRYATSEIQKQIDDYTAWKQHSDALDAQHDTVVSISEDLYQSVSTHSHVYHHLKGSCLEDFDAHVLREVYKLSGEHCNTLQTKCTERVAKNYTCDDFRSDVARFLTELSRKLTEMFREVPLEKVFLRKDVEFEHMEKEFKRMMRNARLLCQSNISTMNNQGSSMSPRHESGPADTNPSTSLAMETICHQSKLNLSTLIKEIMILPFELNRLKMIEWVVRSVWYGILSESSPEALWQDWQSHVNPFHLSATHLASEQADASSSATTDSGSDSVTHLAPKQADAFSSVTNGSESDIPSPIPDPANHSMMNTHTPSSRNLREQQVKDAMKQLKELVHSELHKYAEDLVGKVASDCYKRYVHECEKRLDTFEKTVRQDFEAAWEHHQKEKQLKEKNKTDGESNLGAYIEELKKHQQQLEQIQEHICKKADEVLHHRTSQ